MKNNTMIVLWDVLYELGQGRKYVKPCMLRSFGDMSSQTVYRSLATLVEMGILKKIGRGKYTLYLSSAFVFDFYDAVRALS